MAIAEKSEAVNPIYGIYYIYNYIYILYLMGYVFFIGLLSLQTRDVLWDILYI